MKIVDLSVAVNEQTPVYPGDPATKIEPAGVFKRDGYNDHYISLGTHVGTHIDAPKHMIVDGNTLDQTPIEQFIGRGRYTEVNKSFDLEVVKAAGIEADDIVLFHTGMSDQYDKPVYMEEYPVMSVEIANYLVATGIKMVGVDTCSVDNKEGFPIHKILLGSSVLIIENLTNLAELADKDFTVYALPIKVQVDGAPARVIAEIKE